MNASDKLTELAHLQGLYKDQKDNKTEALKSVLGDYAKTLKLLDSDKESIEAKLKDINKQIMEVQDKIRAVWGPHIAGAERASIDCHGIIIEVMPKLNIKVEEAVTPNGELESQRDVALDWFSKNGYKDVMRWDINTNKMYAIARDVYKNGDGSKIPGLSYKYFQVIKVK